MQKIDTSIPLYAREDGASRNKRFWRNAFIIYALVEMVLLATQYIITRSKCVYCVMPPLFYVVNLLQHLFFTGALWYCLNRGYYLRHWKMIGLNLLLFAAHYFLWITALYIIFHLGEYWLTGKLTTINSFRSLIYASWGDIGKYVVKLTSFYVLKFYFEYRRAEQHRIQLAVINKDLQLNLLKQQLSPHFYFNTLNNLYGLARSNNIKLRDALGQLSSIMQYVIVDCIHPKVLLVQEIIFLQSYMALEKLRYEQDTVIEMRVEGEPAGQTILPLLLVQFVENAFKHGMKEKSAKNWMKVNMLIHSNEVAFRVENSYYGKLPGEGIGINSVKRILDLQYEGKHELEMQRKSDSFLVTLKLNLL